MFQGRRSMIDVPKSMCRDVPRFRFQATRSKQSAQSIMLQIQCSRERAPNRHVKDDVSRKMLPRTCSKNCVPKTICKASVPRNLCAERSSKDNVPKSMFQRIRPKRNLPRFMLQDDPRVMSKHSFPRNKF